MVKGGEHIFFIYELAQIPLLEERLRAGVTYHVVGLDREVEFELARRSIVYVPLRDIVVLPEGERGPLEFARRLAHDWYQDPELSFFAHDGILLGEQHEVMMSYYLQVLVYHLVVFSQVFDALNSVNLVVVPESLHHVASTADATAAFKMRLPVEIARLLAKQRGIPFELVAAPFRRRTHSRLSFAKEAVQRVLFRWITRCTNYLISHTLPERGLRVFSTDPWQRVASVFERLPEAELVMSRRSQMRVMRVASIWHTRARFYHRLDFVDKRVARLAHEATQRCARDWTALGERPAVARRFEYHGVSFWPVAKPLLDHLIKRDIAEAVMIIESYKRMLQRLRINCVLLFSSTKGPNNILARVAESMSIPSIELQHALEVVDPTFWAHARLPARYLAAYGQLTKRHYVRFGVEQERIAECGSPRFDQYRAPVLQAQANALRGKLGAAPGPVITLVMLPFIGVSLEPNAYSSYVALDVVQDFAAMEAAVPDMRLLLRPRPGEAANSLYRRSEVTRLFRHTPVLVQDDDLRTLLALSDLVVVENSTVVLEALLAHKPVIMYLPRLIDHDYDDYEDAGAVLIAHTREELCAHVAFLQDAANRRALVARSDAFLRDSFAPLLDGKSAERVAALIRASLIE